MDAIVAAPRRGLPDRSLEISSRCVGKARIVFLEHAGKVIELIDSPLIGLRYVCSKVRLLCVEQILSKTFSCPAPVRLREVGCWGFYCSDAAFIRISLSLVFRFG
jgi:hypothetical protein